MEKSNNKTVPFKKENNPETSREVVRRNELTAIVTQIIDNVNTMAGHLMNDVNTLFKRFVYPVMMRSNAIENLLVSKGVMTKDEINSEAKRITEEAIAKAKEIKEDEEQPKESGAPTEAIKAKENVTIEKIEHEEEIKQDIEE